MAAQWLARTAPDSGERSFACLRIRTLSAFLRLCVCVCLTLCAAIYILTNAKPRNIMILLYNLMSGRPRALLAASYLGTVLAELSAL